MEKTEVHTGSYGRGDDDDDEDYDDDFTTENMACLLVYDLHNTS